MPRRRYTKAEKATAVGLAAATSTEAAAEQLDIPRRTLRDWAASSDYAELRLKTREALAEMFWVAIQIGVDQVAQGLLRDEPLRDKAVALGVLYDKHALMSGEATSRTESRNVTDDITDDERARLRDWILALPVAETAPG